MKERSIFSKIKQTCILLALLTTTICQAQNVSNLPVPAPHQLKWHEAELGVVFHYDLHVFDGQIYGQGTTGSIPLKTTTSLTPPS